MKFDFTQPITAYEFLAIVLALLALITPLFKWVYQKILKKEVVNFYPSDKIKLFFNSSGAYLQLGGTFESKNRPAIVKDICVNVIRVKDNSKLELEWSSFVSPVFQRIGNNPIITHETSRAFKIDTDGLVPAFIEFTIKDRKTKNKLEEIYNEITTISLQYRLQNIDRILSEYQEATEKLYQEEKYRKSHDELLKSMFWQASEYKVQLIVNYNNNQTFSKVYSLDILEEESESIEKNIDIILLNPLSNIFNRPSYYKVLYKDFNESSM
ncbi:MAG: hypothetical protein AB9856_02995 [Cellulosilyticaceae bacterium]